MESAYQKYYREGAIELLSHRDDRASRIVSAFVVGDCGDETKAQREEHLRSCVNGASGVLRADEDLVDVLRRYLGVLAETDRNVLVKSIDEEVKKLILVDFTVCLLLFARHIRSKQTRQLIDFVKY